MSCKTTEQLKSAKTLTAIIYAMYAASFLVGVIWFIAIIMNYVKRDDVTGTYLESHFRWQIRTFWFSMLWAAAGFLLSYVNVGYLVGLGFIVLPIDALWVLYRIIKGCLYLNDGKEMYQAK